MTTDLTTLVATLFVGATVAGCFGPQADCGPGFRGASKGYFDGPPVHRICESRLDYADSRVLVTKVAAGDELPWSIYSIHASTAGIHVAFGRGSTSQDSQIPAPSDSQSGRLNLDDVAKGHIQTGQFLDLCGGVEANITLWGDDWVISPGTRGAPMRVKECRGI